MFIKGFLFFLFVSTALSVKCWAGENYFEEGKPDDNERFHKVKEVTCPVCCSSTVTRGPTEDGSIANIIDVGCDNEECLAGCHAIPGAVSGEVCTCIGDFCIDKAKAEKLLKEGYKRSGGYQHDYAFAVLVVSVLFI